MQEHVKAETNPEVTTEKQGSASCLARGESCTRESEDIGKYFNSVNYKYFNFDKAKSVIFTKLESSTKQKRAWIVYKIDTGSNGKLMSFWVFKIIFQKSTIAKLQITKKIK